jgi:hypothetical protein
MPTYEELRNYFDESGDLRGLAENTARIPIVSGFTISVDPVWAFCYDVEHDLIDWVHGMRSPLDYPWGLRVVGDLSAWELPSSVTSDPGHRGFRRRDLYTKLKRWLDFEQHYLNVTGRRRLPVIMTIVHRPLAGPLSTRLSNQEYDDQQALQVLVRTTRESGLAVRIEERPVARFAFAPGAAIRTGTGKEGTLGGVLRDSATNTAYGVTCAHVASAGASITDSAGISLGLCTVDSGRIPLPPATPCDPVTLASPNPIPSNGPVVNMLDCALVQLSVPPPGASVGGIATLSENQDVILNGAKTGKTPHRLGALCIGYRFTEPGQFAQPGTAFCFRDAIELLPRPRGLFGGTLGNLMATVPIQGDSGGWVVTEDTPPLWAGMFFGEDGRRGFIIRAAWVKQWAETASGRTLTP